MSGMHEVLVQSLLPSGHQIITLEALSLLGVTLMALNAVDLAAERVLALNHLACLQYYQEWCPVYLSTV